MKIKHDAYLLMEYHCQQCGAVEKIWNGRNAISPFSVGCRSCKGLMQHRNWHNDQRLPDYIPQSGSRYFTDFTRERAEEAARSRIESVNKATKRELSKDEYDEIFHELVISFLESDCSMDLVEVK